MKQGKKPTRRQLKIIIANVATPGDWLVTKSLPDELHLVRKNYPDTTKIIYL
ncbi:hypothetical protein J41TS12_50390 [Paenibacillus antibioticophila]|uniref:DUF6906 domain-containing protein n=1 Tax=Paenibacillus antibioticophila TaxID=1274374 RepID=A0A919XYT7_9BACL|nr:hypothetical protein J41TS12_50390 [Paenibacillus antibioticophila]